MKAYLSSQSSAIEKLKNVKCGALFMEPGTGKTRSAIELIKSTDADYVLWFTPFQTKQNLQAEIKKWGGLDCDIVGIESIQGSDGIYLKYHEKVRQSKKAFIICDESLKIKNATANRTKRLMELSKMSEYRLILNGTPLSRNLLDLWSQMEFLSSKILKMGFTEFKNKFCEYIKINYKSYSKEFIKKYHNLDYLYSLIEPFIYESKLSISVGQKHIDIPYFLTHKEKRDHDAIKKKYLDAEWLVFKNNNIFLEITQKMQHNYSLSSSKFKAVDRLIEGLDKSKVLIYAKYVDTQEVLSKHYNSVKIMSLQKHSYGLNLQDYHTVIFWDKTWDYAQREQIERRIFREGQKNDCTYYDLTGNVGLESMINDNIAKKRNLLDLFNEKSVDELKKEL